MSFLFFNLYKQWLVIPMSIAPNSQTEFDVVYGIQYLLLFKHLFSYKMHEIQRNHTKKNRLRLNLKYKVFWGINYNICTRDFRQTHHQSLTSFCFLFFPPNFERSFKFSPSPSLFFPPPRQFRPSNYRKLRESVTRAVERGGGWEPWGVGWVGGAV